MLKLGSAFGLNLGSAFGVKLWVRLQIETHADSAIELNVGSAFGFRMLSPNRLPPASFNHLPWDSTHLRGARFN